jgi:hypothetical protein
MNKKQQLESKNITPLVEKVPTIRYAFDIEHLVTNKKNTIEEIVFTYKGTLVIAKSLKDSWDAKNHSVQGTFIVPEGTKCDILTRDYRTLSRKEVINFLSLHVRDAYITGLKEIIYKELWPDYKIIKNLPWK